MKSTIPLQAKGTLLVEIIRNFKCFKMPQKMAFVCAFFFLDYKVKQCTTFIDLFFRWCFFQGPFAFNSILVILVSHDVAFPVYSVIGVDWKTVIYLLNFPCGIHFLSGSCA